MSQHVPDAVRARVDSLHDSVTEHWDGLRAELREIKPKLRGWLHLAIAPLTLAAGIVLQLHTPVASVQSRLDGISMLTLLGTRMGIKGVGLDPQAEKRRAAEKATDAIRAKFGDNAITKGRAIR